MDLYFTGTITQLNQNLPMIGIGVVILILYTILRIRDAVKSPSSGQVNRKKEEGRKGAAGEDLLSEDAEIFRKKPRTAGKKTLPPYTAYEEGRRLYHLEHAYLYELFREDPIRFMQYLLKEKGIFRAFEKSYAEAGRTNPFRKDAFGAKELVSDVHLKMICLELPSPDYQGMCERIYLAAAGPKIGYYTVEKDENGGSVCEWVQDRSVRILSVPGPHPKENGSSFPNREAEWILSYFQRK